MERDEIIQAIKNGEKIYFLFDNSWDVRCYVFQYDASNPDHYLNEEEEYVAFPKRYDTNITAAVLRLENYGVSWTLNPNVLADFEDLCEQVRYDRKSKDYALCRMMRRIANLNRESRDSKRERACQHPKCII
jgi:hypothetical protein